MEREIQEFPSNFFCLVAKIFRGEPFMYHYNFFVLSNHRRVSPEMFFVIARQQIFDRNS